MTFQKKARIVAALTLTLLVMACTPSPENVMKVDRLPNIYPDYANVTIPSNIAPLNMMLRDDVEAVELKAICGNTELMVRDRGNAIRFDIDEWKSFINECTGKHATVTITSLKDGQWTQYAPFQWKVSADTIDPYLTYRLIEPDYEIYQNLSLRERCIENFEERAIADYGLVGNRCMNCHTYGQQDPSLSMLYIRGEGGGAILNRNGKLTKLNIKTDDMVSGSVYFCFSPNGRYITFSTNVIIPAFHAAPRKRLEVFDDASDVYVADLDSHAIIKNKLLSDSSSFETFPTFSPDGKYIYYCVSPKVKLPMQLKDMRYSLCRMEFDEQTGSFGETVDTIFSGPLHKLSVCHPRISPDGRLIVFSVAEYGTFPIWHQEADLQMMNLQTGEMCDMSIANSDKSDTYHSWASNSRWLVFASKRDDGLFGKPYFCHIDKNGKVEKPFVLPQQDPEFYDNTLKSFNAPELGSGKLPFDAWDVKKATEGATIDFKSVNLK